MNPLTYYRYRQTFNISLILLGNYIVDHSDVVGATPVGANKSYSDYILILDLTPGFDGLSGKDKCKMRQETFKFWDLVRLILETRLYTVKYQVKLQRHE